MAGLAALAVVAAGCSGITLGEDSPRPTLRKGPLDLVVSTTTTTHPTSSRRDDDGAGGGFYKQDYEPGQCLTWDQDDPGLTVSRVVDCQEPHLAEVADNLDLRGDHGDGAPYPSDTDWQILVDTRCRPAIGAYLGQLLDPRGELETSSIRPQEDGWARGDRTLTCTISSGSPGSERYEPFTGRAADLVGGGQAPLGA
jgi:hypothetical protein